MLKSKVRLLSTSMAIAAGMVTLICDVDAALVPVLVVAPVANATAGMSARLALIASLPTFIVFVRTQLFEASDCTAKDRTQSTLLTSQNARGPWLSEPGESPTLAVHARPAR